MRSAKNFVQKKLANVKKVGKGERMSVCVCEREREREREMERERERAAEAECACEEDRGKVRE